MTLRGGSSLACAVCKFQRRKCKPDCLLAPYFPATQPRVFHNAHRLFGVSNMLKILEGLHPSQHAIAMKTIIDEANMRVWYPVHGCLGVIHILKVQIQMLEAEIRVVYSQLVIYRQMTTSSATGDVPFQLELGMAAPQKTGPLLQNMPQQYNNGVIVKSYDPDNEYVDGGTCSGASIQVASTEAQQEEEGYTELHPFFETIQSFTESKSKVESSSEYTKRSIKCAGEKELRTASCFSPTSVNRSHLASTPGALDTHPILPNIL